MRLQVHRIREHIAAFPETERETEAIAWIEQHARRFRQECRGKLIATAMALETRCDDCPLTREPDQTVCAIHERWGQLLQEYLDKTISSSDYVREGLNLLQAHKDRLKVTKIRGGLGA